MAWNMKSTWGSQPGKEAGGIHASEKLYLRCMAKAFDAGKVAAARLNMSERDCPSKLTEEAQSYWRDGFRKARKQQ
jgi:hypothetical protein